MSSDQVLLALIVVLWAVNVAVVVAAVVQARGRRGSAATAPARPRTEARVDLVPVDTAARTAAAIEAFVAGVDRTAGRAASSRVVSSGASATQISLVAPPTTTIADPPAGHPPEPVTARKEPAGPLDGDRDEPWGSAAWDRFLREESVRIARSRRPATVVFAEVPDLEILAERLGPVAADRVSHETTGLLQAEGRASDRIAQLGPASFAVLLVETNELEAGRYVDRIRAAADGWFAAAGLSTHLAIGWAGPGDDHDLALAATAARERMQAALRGAAPRDRAVGRHPSARRPSRSNARS